MSPDKDLCPSEDIIGILKAKGLMTMEEWDEMKELHKLQVIADAIQNNDLDTEDEVK